MSCLMHEARKDACQIALSYPIWSEIWCGYGTLDMPKNMEREKPQTGNGLGMSNTHNGAELTYCLYHCSIEP